MDLPTETADLLARVTAELPSGEERSGQRDMATAVARAVEDGRHLVVQAGTGTGKSLAYLVPAVLSGRRVVVATATKALQDQLFHKDLPFLAEHAGRSFEFAVLKGRSNYLCRQRAHEIETPDDQLGLDGLTDRASSAELDRLLAWAAETESGDRADLPFEPTVGGWAAVSVSAIECPGAAKCPRGDECFGERARHRAAAADVVVVNTHLYGLHLAAGGTILPEHEIVVLDEAHQVEDVISATSGVEIGAGRIRGLARLARGILADDQTSDDLETAATGLQAVLAEDVGRRIRRMTDERLVEALDRARRRAEAVMQGLRKVPDEGPGDVGARKQRAMTAAGHLVADIATVFDQAGPDVVWVEGPPELPTLKVAPIDVGEVLHERLWNEATAVLTSATVPLRLPDRLGLEPDTYDELDVGSPFDYERHALLYCATHLPDPRSAAYQDEMHDELRSLVHAAGGRTLALFTSWRAMDAAAEVLNDALPGPLLTQRDLPKPALLSAFHDDEQASLFATMGFWQGVDVPGPSLTLVTIDRIPFPRPDDPLLQARREAARAEAFATVDLPRAATLLAQGAGRLIRRATDQGVVAVLDSRLASAGYRWELIRTLPPMSRTKDPEEVGSFLRRLVPS